MNEKLIKIIKFNKDGLVPAIAQQHDTGEVLMLAWMNNCLLYTSPSPRDGLLSRMPSSA